MSNLIIPLVSIQKNGTAFSGELSCQVFDFNDQEKDRIHFSHSLDYQLDIIFIGNLISITGSVSTIIQCQCDYCLIFYEKKTINTSVFHHIPIAEKNVMVDITDFVREDVLITLPQKFLCQPQCAGICQHCGNNLNFKACTCSTENVVRREESTWGKILDVLDI